MIHDLPEWLDLDGRLARLQQVPVVLQFCPVDLGPCFDEPLLRFRKAATKTLDGVDGEHSRLLLIIGVEVRSMMLTPGLDEHPDHDSEKARELGLVRTLHRPRYRCRANACN
jgi:hypothetical protein